MKVEIWSDVMCPFCYIGKRKFENALAEFPKQKQVEIIWKSFQLSPEIQTNPNQNVNELLAVLKGIPLEQAIQMNNHVSGMAAIVGLTYNFATAVVANSLKAHRFSHLAKSLGLQNEAEESLFRAYFTEGRNTDDTETLVKLGEEIGLDASLTREVLEGNQYAHDVRADILEAQQLGIRGVPFFVFDRKIGVSGAQESAVFKQALERSFGEWEDENQKPGSENSSDSSCEVGEDCA